MNQPFSLTHSTHEEKVTTGELKKSFPTLFHSPLKGGVLASIMNDNIYTAFLQRGKGGKEEFLTPIFISLKK